MRFALKTEKAFCHCVDARACWFSFVCIVDGLRGPLPHMHFQSPVHLAVFFRNFRNLFLSLIFGNNSCLCMQFLLSIESPLMFWFSASGGLFVCCPFFYWCGPFDSGREALFCGRSVILCSCGYGPRGCYPSRGPAAPSQDAARPHSGNRGRIRPDNPL